MKIKQFKKIIPRVAAALIILFLISQGILKRAEDSKPAASGILERDRIELPSRSAEQILTLHVREGDFVKAGDPVSTQDSRRAASRYNGALAEYNRAQASLEKMKNGPRPQEINQVEALLTAAEGLLKERYTNLERARALDQKNLNSKMELDSAESSYIQALGNRNELAARLKLLREGNRAEDIRMAQAALDTAAAQLEQAQIDLDDLTIKAPVEGVIDSLPLEEGATPKTGQTVAVLLASRLPYARVYIPEEWHGHLAPGDAVQLKMDGYSGLISGRIR
ncbi:MAG: HlyD family efflux transporter periplasmic adaptor subunit [Spirochaetales bacterium]|nr:HlyD family efflux transporter periplasmic adaptor subunit [Spirochaetales bacterium]